MAADTVIPLVIVSSFGILTGVDVNIIIFAALGALVMLSYAKSTGKFRATANILVSLIGGALLSKLAAELIIKNGYIGQETKNILTYAITFVFSAAWVFVLPYAQTLLAIAITTLKKRLGVSVDSGEVKND